MNAIYRHKQSERLYELISIGKMQSSDWGYAGDPSCETVDMQEVAIYRSLDSGMWWVRPRYEFEDGRFEDATMTEPELLAAIEALIVPSPHKD